MKKVIALSLCLLTLLALLVSCQSPEVDGGEQLPSDVIPSGEIDTTDTDANNFQNDRLPTGNALEELGMAGSEIKILTWDQREAQTFPKGDSTTDPIKSKLYYHWKGIEERFSITLTPTYTSSEYSSSPQFLTDARSDTAQYDLMQTQTLYPITLAMEGRLVNLMPLGFPDLEMPWWPASTEEFSQHGALFFISSNSSVMSINNMAVIFVHTGMITQKGNSDPVQSVLRGTWTVDEITKISRSFAGEAANATEDSRIYGFVVDDASRVDCLYYSCGFSSVKNVNGVGTLGFDEESELQAISNALDSFKPLFAGIGTEMRIYTGDKATDMYTGRTAMLMGFMEYIRSLEDTEAYTVVPLPMLNEEQYDTLGYRTVLRDTADMWCMPITTKNKNFSGMILEANASSEYRNVGPYYYEEYLKDRYANGASGRACFDVLRDSLVYDLGRVAHLQGIGAEPIWRECLSAGGVNNQFVSVYRGSAAQKQNALQEVLATYKKNAGN